MGSWIAVLSMVPVAVRVVVVSNSSGASGWNARICPVWLWPVTSPIVTVTGESPKLRPSSMVVCPPRAALRERTAYHPCRSAGAHACLPMFLTPGQAIARFRPPLWGRSSVG